MAPETFTTQPLDSRDQFEAWREWHQPVLDFLPQQSTTYGFPAEVHIWKLGGLAMSRTSVPPAGVARTKSNLKRDPIDHWVISYCFRGTHFTNTAGTAVEVPAKVLFLSSLGQEFLHERTHIDRVSFLMARDAFRDIAPLLDAACGSTLDTPLGHLLGDYMMALEYHLPDVMEADSPRLARGRRDGRRRHRPVGRACRRRWAANRRGTQGTGAAGHSEAPADTDFQAVDPLPAGRNVPIQSL